MLIATGRLNAGALEGRVVVVSGAGSGIGFEAARSLLWLGAKVVIAEIDAATGAAAAENLRDEFPCREAIFIQTDVGSADSVDAMVAEVDRRLGAIDVICSNATVAPHGHETWRTPIGDWDRSYAVNLRGPVLMARACLPGMVNRGRGVFVCVSSTGGPYLAAYETLKAAQVELANALGAELAGTGVVAFTIGPGLLPTATAAAAVEVIAPKLGLSLEELYAMNHGDVPPLDRLVAFYANLAVLARGYIKDAAAREEQVAMVDGWRIEAGRLKSELDHAAGLS